MHVVEAKPGKVGEKKEGLDEQALQVILRFVLLANNSLCSFKGGLGDARWRARPMVLIQLIADISEKKKK